LFDREENLPTEVSRDQNHNVVQNSFLDRVMAVVWDRKLVKTEKLKRLALLPSKAEKNDVICILYGCSVPVLLRKIDQKTSKGKDIWELIGECYMYEMMSGEALMERLKREKAGDTFYEMKKFKIR